MKVISLLLFIVSIFEIKSGLKGFTEKYCLDYYLKASEEYQAFSKDFCRSLGLEDPDNKCCYIKFEFGNGTFTGCYEITMEEFYNIKTLKKEMEFKFIECNSNSYLYGSLLLISVLLL